MEYIDNEAEEDNDDVDREKCKVHHCDIWFDVAPDRPPYCRRHENYVNQQKAKKARAALRNDANYEERKRKYERRCVESAKFIDGERKRLKEMARPLSRDEWNERMKTKYGISLDDITDPAAKEMIKFVNEGVELKPTPEQMEMFRMQKEIQDLKEANSRLSDLINHPIAPRSPPTPPPQDGPPSAHGPLPSDNNSFNAHPPEYMQTISIISQPATPQRSPTISEPPSPSHQDRDAPSSRTGKIRRLINSRNTSSEEDPNSESEERILQIDSDDEILADTEKLRLTGSPPQSRLHQID